MHTSTRSFRSLRAVRALRAFRSGARRRRTAPSAWRRAAWPLAACALAGSLGLGLALGAHADTLQSPYADVDALRAETARLLAAHHEFSLERGEREQLTPSATPVTREVCVRDERHELGPLTVTVVHDGVSSTLARGACAEYTSRTLAISPDRSLRDGETLFARELQVDAKS